MALNDEIVALVRAGVPLELGLAELGEDRAGTLGRLSSRLAARLSRGETLPEAMAQEDVGLPFSYRVVVEAGLKAGRLTVALEGVSEMAGKMADLRRRIGLAMVYPLIVLMLAYGLFLLFCMYLAPKLKDVFDTFGLDASFVLDWLTMCGRTVTWWGWILPVTVAGLILWWKKTGGRKFLTGGIPANLAFWCPGVRRIAKFYRYAQFADLLALLIEHDVPFSDAIVLAADTTSDRAMEDAARAIAELGARGHIRSGSLPGHGGFPPFLHWLITRREEQTGIVSALRAAADMYRRRAVLRAEWIQVVFPVLAAVLIGGGATLIYTVTVFYPVTELLRKLAGPAI